MTSPQNQNDANDFLMGGGGAPSFSWGRPSVIGTKIAGIVVGEPRKVQQLDFKTKAPMFYDNDPKKPAYQLMVILQTDLRSDDPDDDGRRALYVKGQMRAALRDACLAIGAREGIKDGGRLVVELVDKKPTDGDPQNIFTAAYTPPANASAGFLGTDDQEAAPLSSPAPAAAPASSRPMVDAPGGIRIPLPEGMTEATWNALQPTAQASLAALHR